MQLPEIWKHEIELWFAKIEAQFALSGIESDKSKFGVLLANCDSDTAVVIARIILDISIKQPYAAAKKKLIDHYKISDSDRIRKVLRESMLVTEKPSRFYYRLQSMAGKSLSDNPVLLYCIWLEKLPQHLQLGIPEYEAVPIEKLLKIADGIKDNDISKLKKPLTNNSSVETPVRWSLPEFSYLEGSVSRRQSRSIWEFYG